MQLWTAMVPRTVVRMVAIRRNTFLIVESFIFIDLCLKFYFHRSLFKVYYSIKGSHASGCIHDRDWSCFCAWTDWCVIASPRKAWLGDLRFSRALVAGGGGGGGVHGVVVGLLEDHILDEGLGHDVLLLHLAVLVRSPPSWRHRCWRNRP